MKKRWKVNPANKELQDYLVRRLNILPLTAQLLINRGLVDCDKASSFLRPDLKALHDPFLLKDMDRAVGRLAKALKDGERIAVYGDYDVDGTTSSALLFFFFKEIGVEVRCYIPERQTEGYGLNAEAVRRLSSEGVKVIVTVDCGVSNYEEIRLATELGIDVIVSDHHELPETPPPAYALLNPKQKGCAFPFKGLAGVGVAFNLLVALRTRLRELGWFRSNEPNLKRHLDLVSIGTVADLVPLVDENRILVSYGLRELENTDKPGLRALKESVGLRGPRLTADNIAFQLAPRINAAGRLERAETALRLLTTGDQKEALSLAADLGRENSSRQRLEEEILKDALSMTGDIDRQKGLVLFSEGWHPGVIGIVASRLVDRFSKPAVMIAVEGGVGKGSARGIKSFNMLEGLMACAAHLEKFGGHKAAAGLTVRKENLERFREEFLAYLDANLTEEDLMPEMVLDAVVSLNEVDGRLLSEIDALSPFGYANHEPLLCLAGADIVQTEVVGSRHLRFKVKQNGCSRNGIGFGLAGLHPMSGEGYGIAFSPYLDEWQGARGLKLRIKDVQPECVKFLT